MWCCSHAPRSCWKTHRTPIPSFLWQEWVWAAGEFPGDNGGPAVRIPQNQSLWGVGEHALEWPALLSCPSPNTPFPEPIVWSLVFRFASCCFFQALAIPDSFFLTNLYQQREVPPLPALGRWHATVVLRTALSPGCPCLHGRQAWELQLPSL